MKEARAEEVARYVRRKREEYVFEMLSVKSFDGRYACGVCRRLISKKRGKIVAHARWLHFDVYKEATVRALTDATMLFGGMPAYTVELVLHGLEWRPIPTAVIDGSHGRIVYFGVKKC